MPLVYRKAFDFNLESGLDRRHQVVQAIAPIRSVERNTCTHRLLDCIDLVEDFLPHRNAIVPERIHEQQTLSVIRLQIGASDPRATWPQLTRSGAPFTSTSSSGSKK
jgi:hypothetical protein